LTGITNENNERYVTWVFDAQGRAISSELAGNVDKVALAYNTDGSVTVTNPLGKQTTYVFDVIHNVKKLTQVIGHPSASCAGANKAYSYDANGYIASKTDWKGNITTYLHNARGLETSRTDASGTPQARTTVTEWHATFRLPVRVTEPNRVTEYTYDSSGKLLSKTIRPVE
jgi:YD repeat-containing protein